ncbi:MAG: glycosyltransferase family 39 protein [Bryobacterales bacterium]|nr:glycosyltransferase family 39 protein [Bryobacterales bacterium]
MRIEIQASSVPPQRPVLAALLLAMAAILPYLPFLTLPPISDDYMQIGLARDFISADGVSRLAVDALYRTRATSLLLTRLIEAAAGTDIFSHRLVSVLLHFANGLLIWALGVWPRIGYRRSFAAAIAFLLLASHQEAVIWVAAVHELLVFAFVVLCLLGWVQWLCLRHVGWLALSLAAFTLALYSKESAAVLPVLLAGAWLLEGERRRMDFFFILVSLAAALVYAWAVFAAGANHQHLNDGTFSLRAPFLLNVLRTLWRLYLPWGSAVVLYLLWRRMSVAAAAAVGFSAVTLLPYSFLTYMPFAPSRHTYLAALGLAVAIAFAWDAMSSSVDVRTRRLAILAAFAYILYNPIYLWFKKYPQYEWRSMPTEAFLRFAREHGRPVYVGPSPYSVWVYRYAANVSLGWRYDDVVSTGESKAPEGVAIFEFGLEP